MSSPMIPIPSPVRSLQGSVLTQINQLQQDAVRFADAGDLSAALATTRTAYIKVFDMKRSRSDMPHTQAALQKAYEKLKVLEEGLQQEMRRQTQAKEMKSNLQALQQGLPSPDNTFSPVPTLPSTLPRTLENGLSEQDKNLIHRIETEIIVRETDGGKNRILWPMILGAKEAKYILQHELNLFASPDQIKLKQHMTGRKKISGIIFYGPGGVGKTMLVSGLWGETLEQNKKVTFYKIDCSKVLSKFVGQSERMMVLIFDHARKQEQSILFFDEVHSILGGSDENTTKNEVSSNIRDVFLQEADGMNVRNENLIPISATNHPWKIDEYAARRLGKFIYLKLPDEDERVALLQHNLAPLLNVNITLLELKELAAQLVRYSQADFEEAFNTLGEARHKFVHQEGRWVHVREEKGDPTRSLYIYLFEEEKKALEQSDPTASIIEMNYAALSKRMEAKLVDYTCVWPPCLRIEQVRKVFGKVVPKNKIESIQKMEEWTRDNQSLLDS